MVIAPLVLRMRVRNGVKKFWSIVDSEGVGIFQAIMYVHIAVGGVYGTWIAGGTPQVVEAALGPGVASVWLWLCMGAFVCLVGKTLMKRHLKAGVQLQLYGDAFVLGALSAYVIATFESAWWGKALFTVFLVAGLAECVFMLLIRDIRRIIQIEKILRR